MNHTSAVSRFKAQMLQAREEAIIQTVNRLLCAKGFDAMTVDEVAAETGVAKASLYKHFPSKEHLAGAAMATAMQSALAFVKALEPTRPPLEKLKEVTRWALRMKLTCKMPALPSQSSNLRNALLANRAYTDGLLELSEQMGTWIEQAQAQGDLESELPTLVVFYTLYARACDPVVEFLNTSGLYSPEQIVGWVMRTCFDGLARRGAPLQGSATTNPPPTS